MVKNNSPTKYMANDGFSDPPRCADSKKPVFIFCGNLGPGHLRIQQGVSLGRILGVPFFWRGGGGGLARRLDRTPTQAFA